MRAALSSSELTGVGEGARSEAARMVASVTALLALGVLAGLLVYVLTAAVLGPAA